jgi:16S rRNA (adenine1518-N6/adenine1519-N6)-dimethyltransferase
MDILPTSIRKIDRLLSQLKVIPKRNLGQNFLLSEHWQKELVQYAQITEQELVLEIGPGLGHLTQFLLEKTPLVWSVEIDPRLTEFVAHRFSHFPKFRVWNEDILCSKHAIQPKIMEEIAQQSCPWKIVSNLPYSIATPLILNFLEMQHQPNAMLFTIQKEMAQRLIAMPGTPEYGHVSILAAIGSFVEILETIPSSAFHPKPKVESCLVRLIPKPKRGDILDKKLVGEVLQCAFQMRRKTIWNTLRHQDWGIPCTQLQKILEQCKISPQARGESLDSESFILLSNAIWKAKNHASPTCD